MHELVGFAGTVLMGFFAIMNPIANTPVFLGLTADDDPATRKAVARRSLLLAFAIITAFVLAGRLIFELFGITLPAFRITGGLLITVGAFALICFVSYAFFVSGEKLIRSVGENGVSAITRLMGLILAVIGVQMFIEGAHGAIQSFR